MVKIFRFGLKLAIVGGVVYYSEKFGIWGSSEETCNAGAKGLAYLTPLVASVKKELPIQVKDLPSTDDIARSFGTQWNNGVIASISFVENIPSFCNTYTSKGVTFIKNEIQKERKSTEQTDIKENS